MGNCFYYIPESDQFINRFGIIHIPESVQFIDKFDTMYPNLAWPSRLRRGQAGWQRTSTCNVKSYPSSSADTFRRSDLVHVYFFVIGARGRETCAQVHNTAVQDNGT